MRVSTPSSRVPRRRTKRVSRPALIHQAAFEALEDRALLAAAYDWQSAQIGGGGFVSGVLFSPTQQGLAYARTDVGGASAPSAAAPELSAIAAAFLSFSVDSTTTSTAPRKRAFARL